MEQSTRSPRVVRFGVYELDLSSGELRKQGLKVKLQEQPFQVLSKLLQRPGQVVTREELRKEIWSDGTIVDFEHSLGTAINKIREALADSAENSRFVETLPRRGYRFIAPIDSAEEHATGRPTEGPPKRASAWARWPLAVGGVVAAILLALLFGLNVAGLRERLLSRTAARPIHSIAVLPLENLSRDPEEEYFADGMTEALITDLGKLGPLRVISRTSAMHYKGSKKLLPEIARELNVDAVVEGAVLRSGDRVRITAQLIRATPEKHLWAESYERDLRDILALQSDVARAIAARVQVTLTPQQQQRLRSVRPVNPDAYRAYLRAHHFFNNERSQEGAQKAVEYSLEATRLDPNSAPAFAALADSYIFLSIFAGVKPHEAMPKAKAAAERAVALDPDLPEAHSALGAVLMAYTWNWRGAEREVKRALELNPSDSRAYTGSYASYLFRMGRMDEAVTEAKRVRELDPLSMLSNREVGRMLYYARRYDEALVELQHTAEMFPNSLTAYNWLRAVYLAKGMPEKFMELALKPRASQGQSPEQIALRRAFDTSGMPGYWEKRLQLAREAHRTDLAANIALGKYDEAFELMEKAYKERALGITFIKVDPQFDPIRSDPRFQDLLRRMGLPP